jgi:HPr kinase/phosphorylase
MASITVKELLKDAEEELKLKLIAGEEGLERKITDPDINRPGLEITGHFKYFAHRRIQVLGKREVLYLDELSVKTRKERVKKFSPYKWIPCFIVTRSIKVLPELREIAEETKTPLLRTSMATALFVSRLTVYLKGKLARQIILHGTLVDVYGLGILILGESGIGKSEVALELVKRGHRLVADDVIVVQRDVEGMLMGRCAKLIEYCMEIRGLGIIDVKELFGAGAVKNESKIELVMNLKEWKEEEDYDRLGLREETQEILRVKVPQITIPVGPGRNLAVITEVAAMNERLKKMGHYSAKEIERKLQEEIRENAGSKGKDSK